MGYTTTFSGAIELSRKLTIKEAKELLDIADMGREERMEITGSGSRLQWVPATTLQHIVWDGEEKFYDYCPLLSWTCGWLKARGIEANGTLFWSGEDTGDVGELAVQDNVVTVSWQDTPRGPDLRPLTLSGLQRLALDRLSTQEE